MNNMEQFSVLLRRVDKPQAHPPETVPHRSLVDALDDYPPYMNSAVYIGGVR